MCLSFWTIILNLLHKMGYLRTIEKKKLKISLQGIIREKISYLCYTQSKFNCPKIKRMLLSD